VLVGSRGYLGVWIALEDEGSPVAVFQRGWGEEFRVFREDLLRASLPPCWAVAKQTLAPVVVRPDLACEGCSLRDAGKTVPDVVIRVEHDGNDHAVMGVSYPPGIDVDDAELALLEEIAGDLGFALHGIHRDREGRRMASQLGWQREVAQGLTAERDAAYAKVLHSEDKYRSIFETAANLITSVDREGTIVECNGRIEEVLGYRKDEIVGQSMTRIIHPDYHAKAGRSLATILEKGVLRGTEYRFVRKSGEVIDVRVNAAGLADGRGGYSRTICILEDITEPNRLRKQLHQAQRLETVGRLAGGVAHDFNNLLTVIDSFTNFAVAAVGEDDPVREDLLEVLGASARAASLTRQLLAFSSQQLLEPRVLDVNAVIDGLESMLRRLIGEDIQLEFHPASDLGNVRADPVQIEQVLMNLVVNARDAMPDGGRLVIGTANSALAGAAARTYTPTSPGTHVTLSVSDDGCGMDEATLQAAFEPFFTTKESEKGTGLGLSTVYGVVKQSGGEVSLHSEVGAGTTCRVHLPRTAAAPDEPTHVQAHAATGGGETVLVLEDDTILRRLIVRILRDMGYRALSTARSGDALAMCSGLDEPIHLLLTDVVMPGLGGREVAARMCKSRPQLRVLYMSGYSKTAPDGFADAPFISKPFTPAELAVAVRQALDGERSVTGSGV